MDKFIRTIQGQEVDIRDYQKNYDAGVYSDTFPKQEGGTHLEFYWHDLKSGHNFYDNLNNEFLSNEGIRPDQDINTSRNFLNFSHHIDQEGWKTKYYPPIFDTNGVPRNGRKRIRHFIQSRERWIPAARWTYEIPQVLDNEELNYKINRINTGLDANPPTDYSEPRTFEAIVEAARYLVQYHAEEGKKFNTPSNIDKWFLERGVYSDFSEHIVVKMKEKIENIDQKGNDFMFMLDKNSAADWMKKCNVLTSRKIESLGKQPTDSKEKIILYTPVDVNLYRTFIQHIFPNAVKGIKTLIVLYVTGANPKESIKLIKEFPEWMQEVCDQTVSFIQHDLKGIKIDTPFKSSMYEILGAIPQRRVDKEGMKHEALFKKFELISIEDY
jgi:hypothetical protein